MLTECSPILTNMFPKMLSLLRYPLPLFLVISLIAASFFAGKYFPPTTSHVVTAPENCPGTMEQIRLKDFELVHPLLLTDVTEQSEALRSIQTDISSYIDGVKSSQKADDISVYFRRLDNGAWFAINPNSTYNPASMIKIVYLITYMKMAEKNPQVLNKTIFFEHHFSEGNNQNIVDFQLQPRKYYSVRDLLKYMIKHSDNDATLLLSQNMDVGVYNKIFKDLNVPIPNPLTEYFISVSDFSKFFRVLYSASYTTTELSEYAIELLTESTYDQGLRKGIGTDIKMAHKFGERIIGVKSQLHEFGIIYYNHTPYLLGVMTTGTSLTQLSEILGEISRIALTDYKGLMGNL